MMAVKFRKGMEGFSSRINAASLHYNELHAWLPRRAIRRSYHVPNLLFNMASAIECFLFAINALGNAVDASQFTDVTDPLALYRIVMEDIIGDEPRAGFGRYFSLLQAHWKANSGLIGTIFEYYEVSKYRDIQDNGDATLRTDVPEGFFDGVPEDNRLRSSYTPYELIILGPDIKTLRGVRNRSWQEVPYSTLEQLMADFKPFVDKSLEAALGDAKKL